MAFPAVEDAYTYGDRWVDELNTYLTGNCRFVTELCKSDMPGIIPTRHEGTFLMWLDMRCLNMSGAELTVTLGRNYGVGL